MRLVVLFQLSVKTSVTYPRYTLGQFSLSPSLSPSPISLLCGVYPLPLFIYLEYVSNHVIMFQLLNLDGAEKGYSA